MCENFEDTILVVIFKAHNITDAKSSGSYVTKRHLAERVLE